MIAVTNNRPFALVLHPPNEATTQPAEYAGFEEWVRSRDRVTSVLGGAYLAPTQSLTNTLSRYGAPVTFTARPSWKTHLLDLSLPVATSIFDLVTLGYTDCILDTAARSEPASMRDVPQLVTECLPVLAKVRHVREDVVRPLQTFVQYLLSAYDGVRDTLDHVRGEVRVSRSAFSNWRTATYVTDCRGVAPAPFTVEVAGGHGSADAGSTHYSVTIERIARGDLTGDGKPETAVLLSCHPDPSNYAVEDVQVFAGDPGHELGQLPRLSSLDAFPLPPVYDFRQQFEISGGSLVTAMRFYTCADSHASGPSVPGSVSWTWTGKAFSAHGQPVGRSTATCPDTSAGADSSGFAAGTGGGLLATGGGTGGAGSGVWESGDAAAPGQAALETSLRAVLQQESDSQSANIRVEPVDCTYPPVNQRTLCYITFTRPPNRIPILAALAVTGRHWQLLGIPGLTPGVEEPPGVKKPWE